MVELQEESIPVTARYEKIPFIVMLCSLLRSLFIPS